MAWQLAVSSWSWHEAYYAGRWSLLDLPEGARQVGLSRIEANDFMLPPPRLSRIRRPLLALLPGAPPELWRYSRGSLAQLRGNAAASHTPLLCWTINSDFTVPGWAWPLQQIYLRRGLAAAHQLHTPLLRLNLGGQLDTPTSVDERLITRLVAFVHLCQHRAPGLTLTVENHWGISTDIERHLWLVGQAKSRLPEGLQERLGCCFDPGNMPEGERERWWRGLSAAANHFHFKTTEFDERGRDTHLPHDHILALLRAANYQGDVTIEFQGGGDPVEGVKQSVRLFRQIG
ncbi:MAG: sugar phosphate isomerase/epimerase [Chloroflexi bacterium]|nr:sugar phosphate isomerase/epimerase [Chloroflexota bacterium]